MLLEIDKLSVRYRRLGPVRSLFAVPEQRHTMALNEISLGLQAGETLGLIGESGSGKSTLGRTIIGLERAWRGSIRFEGRELVGLSEGDYRPLRRSIAMIFQDPVASLSPRLSVRELVSEPLVIHGESSRQAHERAARLLMMVGLEPALLGAYPHQLSGGQARRVGIARALALDPRIIIADEPTAGLDVSVQAEIVNLLNRLQQHSGIACLFITHNLAIARHACDRLAILRRGDLCETGPTDAVFRRPSHPYTAHLLRSAAHA